MAHHVSRLVPPRRLHLCLQLVRDPAETWLVNEDECGKPFLDVEWHQLPAGLIVAQPQLCNDEERRGPLLIESRLHRHEADQEPSREASSGRGMANGYAF